MHKFGIWAPRAQKMSVKVGEQVFPMKGPNKRGWWGVEVETAACGTNYAYLIDDDPTPYPYSRSYRQSDGVHVIWPLCDHSLFEWHDQLWRG